MNTCIEWWHKLFERFFMVRPISGHVGLFRATPPKGGFFFSRWSDFKSLDGVKKRHIDGQGMVLMGKYFPGPGPAPGIAQEVST